MSLNALLTADLFFAPKILQKFSVVLRNGSLV